MQNTQLSKLITEFQQLKKRAQEIDALSPAYQKMMATIIKSLLLKKAKLEAEQ